MSDIVARTVLSQKPRRMQRFRNESSFARSDAEQRPDHAGRQYVISARMVARKHVVERLSRDAVTTEDSHHAQQTAARRVDYLLLGCQAAVYHTPQPPLPPHRLRDRSKARKESSVVAVASNRPHNAPA